MNHNEIIAIPFLSERECDQIIEYAEQKEKYFIEEKNKFSPTEDKSYSENQITTANFSNYNFFIDNPQYINKFLSFLDDVLPNLEYPIAVQSWVNIYKKGEGIGVHNHSGSMYYSYSANVFLGGPEKPGITYFDINKETTVENKRGEMHLFNCSLWHMVPKNISDQKRYSIGITLHTYEAITRGILSKACHNTNTSIILLDKLTREQNMI